MKRVAAVLSTILILALVTTTPAFAQHGRPGMMAHSDTVRSARMGMMHEGMMQRMHGTHQMMQNPMHRSSMMHGDKMGSRPSSGPGMRRHR